MLTNHGQGLGKLLHQIIASIRNELHFRWPSNSQVHRQTLMEYKRGKIALILAWPSEILSIQWRDRGYLCQVRWSRHDLFLVE